MDYIVRLTTQEAGRLTSILKETQAGFDPVNSLVCIDTETEGRAFMSHPVNFGNDLNELVEAVNTHLTERDITPLMPHPDTLTVTGAGQALSIATLHFRWKHLNAVKSAAWEEGNGQQYWNWVVDSNPQAFGAPDRMDGQDREPAQRLGDDPIRYAPSAESVAISIAALHTTEGDGQAHAGGTAKAGETLLRESALVRERIADALAEYDLPHSMVAAYWQESNTLAGAITDKLSEKERNTLREIVSTAQGR